MGLTIGTLNVRRSILIEAPPERVWQEFASFEHIEAWLGLGHRLDAFEPWVDGEVEFSVEIDGTLCYFGGPVLVMEPERELSFEINWNPPDDWPVPTFWTLRLTPIYDGTLVELFHHGFERLGADAADELEGYERGWDSKHLEALRSLVGR
ncbi:MAG: SRPBCC domain-containing protein [Pseudomonadales bacterium]